MPDAFWTQAKPLRVVIIGGGFGGLYLAKELGREPVQVTLIDRTNCHLFQPLLYQVAVGGLSPGDIASPLRSVLSTHANTRVVMAEMVDLDAAARQVVLRDGRQDYDVLVLAAGSKTFYFDHPEWEGPALGLKSIGDALRIRAQVLTAYEEAERATDPAVQRACLTFVVVGGGPTGVELAGAVAELAHSTLAGSFRRIDPRQTRILLVEHADRLLPPFPPKLSARAQRDLERLGVTVHTGATVTSIAPGVASIKGAGIDEVVQSRTIVWAAGVRASPLGKVLADRLGLTLDRGGRVPVGPDLSVAGHPELFVIGDLANCTGADGKPLPGVATVAMQQGHYLAHLIGRRVRGQEITPFRYFDKGILAVIGRNAAVARTFGLQLTGFPAWVIWCLVHIAYLVEFDNKLLVMMQWAWMYWTRKRGAQLIVPPLERTPTPASAPTSPAPTSPASTSPAPTASAPAPVASAGSETRQ